MTSQAREYPSGISEQSLATLTLADLLRARAEQYPNQTAYRYLDDGEGQSQRSNLTYSALHRSAQAVAAELLALTVRGDRALLLYPPGMEFISAFFGSLYAGVVAVPAYPARNNRGIPRIRAIVQDARPSCILTTSSTLSTIRPLFDLAPDLAVLDVVATDLIEPDSCIEWEPATVGTNDLAFLQYTSGSTGTPKGVMLTHANLLHNASMVFSAVEHSLEDKYVSWLPTFHDMGFMAGVLEPLFAGVPAILMSPISFLQRPLGWLEAISRFRGTTSGAPNFAYELCVRKIPPDRRADLDLSTWTVAFNGAEPIRAETIDRFVAAFEPCGFRREAFFPCYGLAEATLIVSGCPKSSPPTIKTVEAKALQSDKAVETLAGGNAAQSIVGSGRILGDQKVMIVNTDSTVRCPAGEIGEIWVSGPSIARGYWNNPDESETVFRAHPSDTVEGPFLRTGDLGFIQNGELFVTGRLKDLIILRGRNHYPQDIELAVESSHPALRPGCGAAFSITAEGEERLVVVQEVDARLLPDDIDGIISGIRRAVAEEHELQTYAIKLIKSGTVPKTSSGKIRRKATKELFLAEGLDVVAEWHGGGLTQDVVDGIARPDLGAGIGGIYNWLVRLVAQKLRVDDSQIGVDQPVTRYGLDSLIDIELVQAIKSSTGVSLPVTSFLQGRTIADLAAEIEAQAVARIEDMQTAGLADISLSKAALDHQLSYGQRAIWFLYELAPNSAAYNIAGAVRIPGKLDVDALRQALQELVERHPTLRTCFASGPEGPVQQVREVPAFILRLEDASIWSETTLESGVVKEAHLPFDLARGPLLRATLFERPGHHVLVLVVHHIAADLWSLAVLLDELGVLYGARTTGRAATLPPCDSRYADYVRYQAEIVSGTRGDQLWRYWQKQLAGELPAVNLPTDRPRPAIQTYRGRSFSFVIEACETNEFKALARAGEATLNMVLLASFQVLLLRYTEQEDILIGCPASGRSQSQFDRVVGYFVNPVVIRADLSGNPTFGQLLARVRETALPAFEHQDFPFPLLVERLQPDRDPSRSPLFQVMFTLQKTPLLDKLGLGAFAIGKEGARVELGGLAIESMHLEQQISQFDLTLMATRVDGRTWASFQYNSDLFDLDTIKRMSVHLNILLDGLAANPGQFVRSCPLLSGNELYQVLTEWNDTRIEFSQGRCVHYLFEQQTEQTPDRIAVVAEYSCLSYRELNTRSNQMARHLQRLGVGPEMPVGICLERTLNMVIGILAVLKAGGTYVPLDPEYPQDRLALIIKDSGAQIVITEEDILGRLQSSRAATVIPSRLWTLLPNDGAEDIECCITPEHLAYVIYTSGSTGKPKGVAIRHGGAVTLLDWARLLFSPEDVAWTLASTSICFDLSVFELFAPLSQGGTVLLAENILGLPGLQAVNQITLINTVPSAMSGLLRICKLPPSARVVNLAGEALPAKLVEETYRSSGIEKVFNLYGPSEDTTYSTYALVDRTPGKKPLIGRPTANTKAYLLDEGLEPKPPGLTGELCIAGEGLARCYLNRPDITAEKFVPNPFAKERGSRLYRTGDLARHRPDGNIDYMGRADHQVKVRGFRIELGEIEATFRSHPSILDAVVVLRRGEPGETRLVAYAVARPGHVVTIDEARSYLGQTLPGHMLPSDFVSLESLPTTPNGKIDRNALPDPDPRRPVSGARFVGPRTATEEVLEGVWRDVLRIGQISITDNFFELGGHSLLATQVISRVRRAFNVEIPLHRLFENPTVATLALSIEDQIRLGASLRDRPIPPIGHDGLLPLSFAQQRLFFINQLDVQSWAYNMSAAGRIAGPVNGAALEQTLGNIVLRHASLRTSFQLVDGSPIQAVTSAEPLRLPLVDFSGLPLEIREAAVERLTAEQARKPFDLSARSAFRPVLVQVTDLDHILLLTVHHIVSDGWSLGIFTDELQAHHRAFSVGGPSTIAQPPVQYAAFAQWQRYMFEEAVVQLQLSYWKRRLEGDLPVLRLPVDRPRPPAQSLKGTRQLLDLPAVSAGAVKAISREEGVTLFMTLMSAFNVLLYRYTGQVDLIVGTPIAGRNRWELETLIGFFVNTLIIRTDVSGRPTFRELQDRMRDVCLEAYAHQDVPFERLAEELEPERMLSHNVIFQAMFALQNWSLPALDLAGQTMEFREVVRDSAKFDLTFNVSESQSGGLEGWIEYNTDVFDSTTIERMSGHYHTLLGGIVQDPDRPMSCIEILTHPERRQLLVEWNDTDLEMPRDASMHKLFRLQADRTSDAVAVAFEGDHLSYGRLNRRANQLAHNLRRLGTGPDEIVGLCLERSIEMMIAVLGILKAGAAYLPIDPAYPKQRLEFMIEDSGIDILITQRDLAIRFDGSINEIICLDGDSGMFREESQEEPLDLARRENLAYVIYTSGSTGDPKGVMVEHRSFVNLAEAFGQATYSSRSVPLRVSLNAPLVFDASVKQWMQLLYGHTLIVIPEHVRADGSELVNLIANHRIEVLDTTPAQMKVMLEAGLDGNGVAAPHVVFVAGEAIDEATWRILASSERTRFYNLYGPTECTDDTTYQLINGDTGRPTIGKQIGNIKLFLLDQDRNLAPAGVPAEMYIGGASPARGYLNRPDLSAERYTPSEFGGEPGGRVYRTGDVVKRLIDGNIEYVGRTDKQVKIRGFRIEPGEIEAVLGRHPGVRQTVVVSRDDATANNRLVAYVVPADNEGLAGYELRDYLEDKLPEHMIPSEFVILEEFPLTHNRKIDLAALPPPGQATAVPKQKYSPPRDTIEQQLADIFAEVLGLERVGIQDDFFKIGGHSLLGIQTVARIRKAFQVDFGFRSLFESRTVAQFGERIRRHRKGGYETSLPVISPAPRDAALPLSYAQWRLWFLDQLVPGSPVFNVFAAIRIEGALEIEAFEQGLNEIVRRHEILRSRFPNHDSKPVQMVAPLLQVPIVIVVVNDLGDVDREEVVKALASEEARRPFNLSEGPLIRTTLLQLDNQSQVLLLNVHHIVSDDWSVGIFSRELSELYSRFARGIPSQLPELHIQYADFAHWQLNWITDDILETEISHWKSRVGDIPPILDLPTDHPRPPVQSYRGAARSFQLPASLSSAIRQTSAKEGKTLFMTLLAGFGALLHRCSDQEKIIVGIPVANRSLVDIESLIGIFINILAPCIDLSGNPSYRDLLNRAQDATLDAFDHQDLPFEKLVEALHLKRDMSRPPLRQVAFAFKTTSSIPALELPGIAISPLEIDIRVSRLDLTLFVWEDQDLIKGSLEYNIELFEETTIERFLHHFEILLEDMVSNPERAILGLPPLMEPGKERSARRQPTLADDIPYEDSNMTQGQLLFWFSNRVQHDDELYFDRVRATLTIDGPVNHLHFQRAFQKLVDNSDAMRTVIDHENGVPRTRVRRTMPFIVDYRDWSAVADPSGAFRGWLQERLRAVPDFWDRLFDCALAKLSDNQFVWYLSIHHIVTDLWSESLIVRFVSDYYRLSSVDRLDEAEPLAPYQYYVDFERNYRGSAESVSDEEYWRKKLSSNPGLIRFYRSDSQNQTTLSERRSCDLGRARSQTLNHIVKDYGFFSPAVGFLAVLSEYLYRFTPQSRIRIGSSFANRSADFKNTIGLLFNICPIEIQRVPGDSFVSLGKKTQSELIDTARHQNYPVRNPQINSIYNINFTYQNVSIPAFAGMPVKLDLIYSGHSNYDFALQVRDFNASGSFVLDFDFNCGAFNEDQQERSVGYFIALLDRILENPDRPLYAVEMISDREKRQLLVDFNETSREFPRETSWSDLFDVQVELTPDSISASCEDHEITYTELRERARRLTTILVDRGVGPEVTVGLLMERGLDLLIAIVGVLKAGGAYLPLDQRLPSNRLLQLTTRSRTSVIVCAGKYVEAAAQLMAEIPSSQRPRLVEIEELDAIPRQHVQRNRCMPCGPRNLAYVIYTSGSTGMPKGVMIEHRGMINHLYAKIGDLKLTPDDVVAQTAPHSFDISVWQFLAALLAGGRVHIFTDDQAHDPSKLLEGIERERITVIEAVPSLLQALLDHIWQSDYSDPDVSCLRWFVPTGEALPPELSRQWLSSYPDIPLLNAYGPTECSDDVTHYSIYQPLGVHELHTPIGRPIANTTLFVFTPDLLPMPMDIPGELYVGGVGVGRGYLHDPQRTAEAFIPSPARTEPGARLYRTGDLGSHLESGNIEFLGRVDNQVKIRGYRIELAEIEAMLSRHPAVQEVVVLAHKAAQGDKYLVAYLVPEPGTKPSVDELRDYLKEWLPGYMVPAAFVHLDAIPLTPNGKVNREALPAPDHSSHSQDGGFVSPRTPLEEILVAIWADILHLERVGVNDDFFELGGHSLLATRLVSHLHQELMVQLPLRAIFDSPTVSKLAETISQSEDYISEEDRLSIAAALSELQVSEAD